MYYDKKSGILKKIDFLWRQVIVTYIFQLLTFGVALSIVFSSIKIPAIDLSVQEIQAIWITGLFLLIFALTFAAHKYTKNASHRRVLMAAIIIIGFFGFIGLLDMLGIVPMGFSSIGIASSFSCPSSFAADGQQPAYCNLYYYGGDYGAGTALIGVEQVSAGQTVTCTYTFNGLGGQNYGTNYCVPSEVQCPVGTSLISYNGPGSLTCTSSPSVTTNTGTAPSTTNITQTGLLSGTLSTAQPTLLTSIAASIFGFLHV